MAAQSHPKAVVRQAMTVAFLGGRRAQSPLEYGPITRTS